jgi:hypothetical protein
MGWVVTILAVMLFVGLLVYLLIDNRIRNPRSRPGSWHPLDRKRDRTDLHQDAPGYKSYGKLDRERPAAPKDKEDEVRRYPFTGVGTQTTVFVFLDSGVYYLVCQFPNDQKLTVDLVTEGEDARKTITTTAGYATVSFSVKAAHRYAFHVQADNSETKWTILVKPL